MVLEPIERNPDGTPKGYPCCARTFPDPDPMMRFIDPDEGPDGFWQLPHDERARRARVYLIGVAAGFQPLMAWMTALDFTETAIAKVHYLIDVENADDRRVVGLIERGAREKLMEEMRLRTPAAQA